MHAQWGCAWRREGTGSNISCFTSKIIWNACFFFRPCVPHESGHHHVSNLFYLLTKVQEEISIKGFATPSLRYEINFYDEPRGGGGDIRLSILTFFMN